MLRTIVLVVGFVVVAIGLIAPSPIRSKAWDAPRAPSLESGPYAKNQSLSTAQAVLESPGKSGPEYIEADRQGKLYTGYSDGSIVAFDPSSNSPVEITNTGGRPLGMRLLPNGLLIVADAQKGLLEVSPTGKVNVLADSFQNRPLLFVDDVAVTRDGRHAYFTQASAKFPIEKLMFEILEHGSNGRLFMMDLNTREVSVVAGDLYFPNGIQLMPDEQSVLVNETSSYRILKIWIKGPKAGQSEVWASNLPGFPDNITIGKSGRVWVSLVNPRDGLLDGMADKPWLKDVVARLPEKLFARQALKGQVVAFDLQGKLLNYLADDSDRAYGPITTAREEGGWLYLGSLTHKAIARLPLPAPEKN